MGNAFFRPAPPSFSRASISATIRSAAALSFGVTAPEATPSTKSLTWSREAIVPLMTSFKSVCTARISLSFPQTPNLLTSRKGWLMHGPWRQSRQLNPDSQNPHSGSCPSKRSHANFVPLSAAFARKCSAALSAVFFWMNSIVNLLSDPHCPRPIRSSVKSIVS